MGHLHHLMTMDAIARRTGTKLARRRQFFDLIFMWGQSKYDNQTNVSSPYNWTDSIG